MGLKIGFSVIAAEQNLFVALASGSGHPCTLAQVKVLTEKKSKERFILAYPNGSIGVLRMNYNMQFEVIEVILLMWCPTEEQTQALFGTLSKDRIMFNGEYKVPGNLKPSDFSPPDKEHATDEERFLNPRDLWSQVVKNALQTTFHQSLE